MKIGDVVVLLQAVTFPFLYDDGIRPAEFRAGLAVQISSVDGTGVGIEVRKGQFITWINRAKLRAATAAEAEDFLIATGDQTRPRKARRAPEAAQGTQNATAANVAPTAGHSEQPALPEAA